MLGGKETGGMNVYVRDLSRELGRRGIAVDCFTRSQNPDFPRISTRLGPNCRVIHLPAGPEAPYDKNLVVDHLSQFVRGALDFTRREGLHYDVIHSHYWLSGLAARDLRRAWGAPIIQMFHTLGHMKNSVASDPQAWESERRIEGEAEVMAFADRLVAATSLERAQMVWLYGADASKIAIAPCGVDLDLFHPMPPEEARLCGAY
jgi:D-inositol-3-phosphate glycosyltransferase